MTDARRVLLVGLALVAVAVVLWRQAAPRGEVAPSAARSADGAVVGTPAPGTSASAPAPRPTPEPLPPKDAPLAEIAGALEARANAGDSRARCRLAVELLRCQQLEDFLASTKLEGGQDSIELGMEAEGQFDQADRWAQQQIWQIRQQAQCRRLPEALHARSWNLLREAALAGEPEAMLRYAEGSGLQSGGRTLLQHPGLDNWRREAPIMVERALQAGHREAIAMLFLGHTFKHDPFVGLIRDDPERALALQILSSRLRRVGMPPLDRFNATQIAAAMRQAETWHTSYFGGRFEPPPTTMGMISPLTQHDPGEAAPCE